MNRGIVILGIGNLLMSDDGVGVHAAHALAKNPPPGVLVVDAGTDVLSTLPFLEDASRAIIIDALQAGAAPGTLRQLTECELAPTPDAPTTHAINLLAARRLLPPGTPWPEVAILGVEPAVLAYGMTLSPAVSAALPLIEQRCRDIVAAWQTDSPHIQTGRSA